MSYLADLKRYRAQRAYATTLSKRIRRNANRLLHGQDGRGNLLTVEQSIALVIAIEADLRDQERAEVEA